MPYPLHSSSTPNNMYHISKRHASLPFGVPCTAASRQRRAHPPKILQAGVFRGLILQMSHHSVPLSYRYHWITPSNLSSSRCSVRGPSIACCAVMQVFCQHLFGSILNGKNWMLDTADTLLMSCCWGMRRAPDLCMVCSGCIWVSLFSICLSVCSSTIDMHKTHTHTPQQ